MASEKDCANCGKVIYQAVRGGKGYEWTHAADGMVGCHGGFVTGSQEKVAEPITESPLPVEPLVDGQYDTLGKGHEPEDVLRITAHDLSNLQVALRAARKACKRREGYKAERDALRTALEEIRDFLDPSNDPPNVNAMVAVYNTAKGALNRG